MFPHGDIYLAPGGWMKGGRGVLTLSDWCHLLWVGRHNLWLLPKTGTPFFLSSSLLVPLLFTSSCFLSTCSVDERECGIFCCVHDFGFFLKHSSWRHLLCVDSYKRIASWIGKTRSSTTVRQIQTHFNVKLGCLGCIGFLCKTVAMPSFNCLCVGVIRTRRILNHFKN